MDKRKQPKSEEHKRKIAETLMKRKALFGFYHSDETKEKIRAAHKGRKLPKEWKEKIIQALKGRPVSEETRGKIRGSNLGKKRSVEMVEKNRLKGLNMSQAVKDKISKTLTGQKPTDDTRRKLSESQKAKGSNHHLWKGGVTPINQSIRHSVECELPTHARGDGMGFKRNNQMTELNLFLRFNVPSNEGNSTSSKARSMPEFLNPKESMFFAAFLSLSWVVLQFSQVHSLSDNSNFSFLIPQAEHILLLGSNLPIYSTFLPFHSDLYFSIFSNIFHPQSLIAPASLWFLTMPLIFKSSRIIRSKRLVISFDALCKKSARWFATLSCCFAILNFQTFLRLLPFTFLESCRCIHFNFTCALRKCFGLAYSVPSEQTANVLIPKSIPTALLLLIGFGSSLWLSTNIDTKYLLVGVLLMVTVLISPVNFLCNIALIGCLNFGRSIVFALKSIVTFCGNWKDCFLDFFLKLGYSARPLKKFWNELSKFRKAICKHWLFTSRNQSHSFLRSVNCADKSLYESCTLLPAYAVCLHSRAKLYRNLTEPKCLSKSTFCSSFGKSLYLKAFNMIQIYTIYRTMQFCIRKHLLTLCSDLKEQVAYIPPT